MPAPKQTAAHASRRRRSPLASERHLRAAVEAGRVGLWDWDLRSDEVEYSAEWKRQLGFEDHEITGGLEEWQSRLHPDDLERTLDTVKRYLANPWPDYENEFRLRHKDGSYRWILARAALTFDADGRQERMLGSHFDVTGRKQVEEALRAEEERYRILFASNPHPMWVYDLETLRFVMVNDAAVEHYGYSREEFLAMTIAEIRPPEDVPRLLANVRSVGDALDKAGNWRHRLRDGRIIEVEITSHVLAVGGRPSELVLALDITARRDLEKRLLEAHKLEAIGRLAGGVAHDFNNLMAVILMQTELLREAARDSRETLDGLAEIQAAAERAATLTRQLLQFSRRQQIRTQVLDLNEVVSGLAEMLRRILGENAELELGLHPAPLSTQADAGLLAQILVNLVLNARDAMPKGGRLRIETFEEVVGEASPGRHPDASPGVYACLRLADSGEGILPADLPHLFEPFYTTKPAGAGTGLGLATVFGIARQHGGWVQARSLPDRGAEFLVYLPASDTDRSVARESGEPVS